MISLRPKRPQISIWVDMFTFTLGVLLLVYLAEGNRISKFEWGMLGVFALLWIVIAYWKKHFYSKKANEFKLVIINHFKAYSFFVSLIFLFYIVFPISMPSEKRVLFLVVGFPVLGILINFLLDSLINLKPIKKKVKYALVAGTGNAAKNVVTKLYSRHVSGYQIKGFVNCLNNEDCLIGQENVVSDLSNFKEYLNENLVDEIVIALPGEPIQKVKNILETADYFGIRVKYVPDYHDVFGSNYRITRHGEIDVVNIHQIPTDDTIQSFLKNTFDTLFSFTALVLLMPVFLVISALIKLDSSGPVFYCPIRIGRSGKPFKLFKFRTMLENDTTSNGMLSTKRNDPRITKLGKILRKYSLDELPQFLNVLLGQMSVVGPRPHRRYLDQELQQCVYRYMIRHYVKPGITGWAQVNGWRGPTDTEEQKNQRTSYDIWYLENWSLWLDIKIIFLTLISKKAHNTAF